MKLTEEWLKNEGACDDGTRWFVQQDALSANGSARYAVFAAEKVLHIYEKAYPGDHRPRKAVEAAKTCITDPAAGAARAAIRAAGAARAAAAWAAAWAARSSADAAWAAAWAAADARASARAARVAAWAAADAADAEKKMITKILLYGLTLGLDNAPR